MIAFQNTIEFPILDAVAKYRVLRNLGRVPVCRRKNLHGLVAFAIVIKNKKIIHRNVRTLNRTEFDDQFSGRKSFDFTRGKRIIKYVQGDHPDSIFATTFSQMLSECS